MFDDVDDEDPKPGKSAEKPPSRVIGGYKRKPWHGVSAPYLRRYQMQYLISRLMFIKRELREENSVASELLRILIHLEKGKEISETDREFASFLAKQFLTDYRNLNDYVDTTHRLTTLLFEDKDS